MNSDNGDMRYKVYIWGFLCLNYSLDILISWIHNLSFVQLVLLTFALFGASLHACAPVSQHSFLYMLSDLNLSIHVWLLKHATWRHFTYSLGCFLTTPGPAYSNFRACTMVTLPWSLLAQQKHDGSAVNHLWLFSSCPLLVSSRDSLLPLVSTSPCTL